MHNQDMHPDDPKQKAHELASLFKAAGITQTALAMAMGVNQSQVSRVLSGQITRRTKLLNKLCIYAESKLAITDKPDVRTNRELMAALGEVWDGTATHAHALAQVIRSLAQLHPVPPHLHHE
ncbi:helix-turn-helix transcriptional regulator [Vogesella sp. LIG4]|uniref:helix-turn-helix domain-containing protein n=1 Tax=Vogesella sp. LIG4 TaxID=1192162 RepID=UPI0018D45BDE|nr:helix-turn-helix transcriptional regulator [Vogesella sp. LIG4]